MYTHIMLFWLINECLQHVAFSMTKALNHWSPPKRNSHGLHPSNLISKILFLLLLVFLFFTLSFLFQTLKNLNWLHFNWDFVACGLIKYKEFEIIENSTKSYKTPYSFPYSIILKKQKLVIYNLYKEKQTQTWSSEF